MSIRRTASGKLTRGVKPPRYYGYVDGSTVQIAMGKIKCQFITPFPQAMDKGLAAPHPGYFFMPSYKNGNWDGHHHFITRAGYFPTGLLPLVYHILTTGINPLIDEGIKGHKVLPKPVNKVEVIIPEDMRADFYPGLLTLWEDFDVLSSLAPGTGTFAYPAKRLNMWKRVEKTNPLARNILAFAKSLVPRT